MRLMRIPIASHPARGVLFFFVFSYPPFQFLKLVVIVWWLVAAFLSVKRFICSAAPRPEGKAN